ncbi:hypothetical protein JOM56_011826 [Amanita muscaria]
MHATHAQGSHVQSAHTQGTQGAQGVTFHQNQNQSTSSSSSSVIFGPAFVSSPPPLSSPPPPPPPLSAMVAVPASPVSGHVPTASVGASAMISRGGTSTEGAGNWSVSRDGRGGNPNSGTAVNNNNNSNSSKINSANNSGSSTNSNTALVRPLPLPPGSTPRTRTRSNNAINVLGGPPGSHTSSVNVPISWASRPVDLNRTVPASSSVSASHAGHSGGEQHQQHTLQQHQQHQLQQPLQQGQGQQQKAYSRPPSRPSLRSSRPSSPSAPSPPPRPPSNLAFGPGPSSASAGAANVGAGRPSSPPPRSKTITSTTRSTTRGGRLRSRSTSRPKTQVPAGAAGVLRYESFSGVGVAMGTASAMTSPTAPPNTAPPQARLAPQGSRTIPSARKRSATQSLESPSNVTITKSQPVGSGLTTATNTTTSQPMTRQAPKRSAIPPRSTPPQSQLPSPPSVSHHHGNSHGHASTSGLTAGRNTSLLMPLSTPTPPTHTTTQGAQSGSKRHQGGVQLSRQLVSRAAAVPAPLNPNYNCVGVAKGGVYYVRDNDYPYHQGRQDEKGKGPETSMMTTTKRTFPVRPLPKPAVQPLSSDKQPAEEDVAGIYADAEDGGKPTIDNDNDDDGISCLSYIDSPDSIIGVHPDLGSLSFGDDDMALSDGGREDPLLVYIDDNFDSSEEDEEFAKSVSPMRYARPGSDGTVDSGDDGGSDLSSDFFSDVDDPFKYNKGRSKRRGRTRTTVPVGRASGSSNETAGVGAGGSQSHKGAKEKLGIRMTGSLGSMRDLIESKAAKEKRKKEAADTDAGAIAARTKSAERDRALPQGYGHAQESPLPPPPPRLMWFTHTRLNNSKVSLNEGLVGAEEGAVTSIGGGGGDKMISPVSLSSSQGGRSLSPMRYAKRMSVELLDDSSSLGSPISPIGVGGLLKGKSAKSAGGKKKRSQPWSYQFDYQAAKASSPFTFGMGGEKAADVEEKEEEKKKAEESKKREKAKSLRGFKTKEGSESRKKLSIDVLDISLLRRSSQPALLGPGDPGAGGDDVFGLGSGGGSGGSGQQTFRTWDDSPGSSATGSSFTVIAAPGTNNPVVITPPSPPPIATTTSPPGASTVGRTRTFKVRNP